MVLHCHAYGPQYIFFCHSNDFYCGDSSSSRLARNTQFSLHHHPSFSQRPSQIPLFPSESQSSSKYDQLRVVRTKEWVAMAAGKLKVLVKDVASLVSHSNWRVRLSLADGTATLLKTCARYVFNDIILCSLKVCE